MEENENVLEYILKITDLIELQVKKTHIVQDNTAVIHQYLSCLIADYCEKLAELTGLSPLDIHNNIKARLDDFPKKPESHLYVVRD